MADKKKTEDASDGNGRSEEDRYDELQAPDEVTAEPEDETTASDLPEDEDPDAGETRLEPSPPESIEDAEVIGQTPPEPAHDDVPADPGPEGEEVLVTPPEDSAEVTVSESPWEEPDPDATEEEDLADLEAIDGTEETVASDDSSGVSEDAGAEREPDTTQTTAAGTAALPVEREPVVVERRGGFIGGFLGGIVATLGLAFAAPFVLPENMMPDFGAKAVSQNLAAQVDRVAALENEVENLQGTVSDAAAASDLAALQSQTEETIGSLQSTVETVQNDAASAADLEAAESTLQSLQEERQSLLQRIDELEKRPIAEATDPASVAAVEAYGREVAALRDELEQTMSRAEDMVSQASNAAQQAVDTATSKSQEALAQSEAQAKAAAEEAQRVARASALVDVQAAIESGQPYQEALAKIDGVEIPEALAAEAEVGVPTLGEVREAFDPAARAALHASRQVREADSVEGRIKTFLQSQTGIRSLKPREGDDPDAVLSRAQAATAEGRLQDAIAEISALPEAGQEQMADWVEMAQRRAEAIAATDQLSASLTTN